MHEYRGNKKRRDINSVAPSSLLIQFVLSNSGSMSGFHHWFSSAQANMQFT